MAGTAPHVLISPITSLPYSQGELRELCLRYCEVKEGIEIDREEIALKQEETKQLESQEFV
jgi:hypothetical protein